MSIRALSIIWDTSKLKGGDLLVLLALADYANEDMEAWPSVASLSKKARVSERAVQYALRKGEKSGEIIKLRKGGVIDNKNVTARYRVRGGANFAPGGELDCAGGVKPVAPNPSGDPVSVQEEDIDLFRKNDIDVPFADCFPAKLVRFDHNPPLANEMEIVRAWMDFVEDRKERKKPLTVRAAQMLLETLAERPKHAAAALLLAIKRGWRGFEWDWYDKGCNGKEFALHTDKVSPAIRGPEQTMSVTDQRRRRRGQ